MKLNLYNLDVFFNEVMDRGIKTVYYYYEEYDNIITFTASEGSMLLSYVLREMTVTFDKDGEIKKLQDDLPGIKLRRGIITT